MRHLSRALAAAVLAVLAGGSPAHAIVGGKDAPARTYDAVAYVSIAGAGNCTGTLIDPSWVMSAGHCGSLTGTIIATPIAFPAGAVTVTLGTTAADHSGGDTYSVDDIRLSSQYLNTEGHDVTLLHLTSAARQTPVRIAGTAGADIWKVGTPLTIAGFGTTKEGGDQPATMQVAEVPRVKDDDCAAAYSTFEPVTQLCAGYPQGGTDSCQGDSGGPLFGHDGNGALKLVGATSYGDGCAQPGKYGIYARVADTELREWVRGIVPGAIDDTATATKADTTGGGPSGPPVVAKPVARLVKLTRSAKGGSSLTVKLSVPGTLTISWKVSGRKTVTRSVPVKAGTRRIHLTTPRGAKKVAVTVSLISGRDTVKSMRTFRLK